jgi:probable H4MPT-linked C1 transfer pathway protein
MYCGWDLGGAHVKRVLLDASGAVLDAAQRPCRLWLGLHELTDALEALRVPAQADAVQAVTMTGELVDLFADRASGVHAILDAFVRYAGQARVLADDTLVDLATAHACWDRVASANWRATSLLAAGALREGLVLDIGSTTTDVVPVRDGEVLAAAEDDHGRLRSETLVYSGVVRTPLMAVAQRVPFGGAWVDLMAEHFATTGDVYRILGALDPAFDQADTADGQGRSRTESARRLARMLGTDAARAPDEAWQRLAAWLARVQVTRIADACERQLSLGQLSERAPVVGLGVGCFLAERVAATLARPFVAFSRLAGIPAERTTAIDVCGPAYAVARLAMDVAT